MISLYLTIFVTSLLGSVHCAGMCGVFAAFSARSCGLSHTSPFATLYYYHIGRLITYLILGGLAGLVGESLNRGGLYLGIQYLAGILASITIILYGFLTLFPRHDRFRNLSMFGSIYRSLIIPLNNYSRTFTGIPRAFITGFLTTFIPCGWLYMYVVVAMGTGNFVSSSIAMFVFWCGTIPLLSFVGAGFRRVQLKLPFSVSKVPSMIIVVVGLYTINYRLPLIYSNGVDNEQSSASIQKSVDELTRPFPNETPSHCPVKK